MSLDLAAGAAPALLLGRDNNSRLDPDVDDANVAEDETLLDEEEAFVDDEQEEVQPLAVSRRTTTRRTTTMAGERKTTRFELEDRVAYAPRLPWRTRLGYAVGDVSVVVPNQIVNFFKNIFLLDVAMLRPSIVGIVLLVSTLWDACTDIMFGLVSDATVSRLGRRRPYILLGAIVYAGLFFAFWQSPGFEREDYREAYYFVTFFLYKTCATVLTIPYYALVSELTSSYTERTFLTSLRTAISSLFGLAIVPVWTLLTNAFPLADDPSQPDLQLGYAVTSTICLPIIVVPAVIVFATVREPAAVPAPKRRPSLRTLVGSVLANRAFLLTLGVFLSANLAAQFVINNLALYVKYVLRRNSLLSVLLLALQAFTIMSVIFWAWLASRISKHHTFMLSIVFFVVPLGLVWLLGPSTHIALVFLAFGCGGVGVGGLSLLPWTMMADCVDVDELTTGIRREGLYFSLFVLLQKCALAGALAGANYALDGAGYVTPLPGAADPFYQPQSVITALKVMIGPVPCALSIIALVPAFFYPLSREKHHQLTEQLKEQRRFRAATRRSTLATTRHGQKPVDTTRASCPDLTLRPDGAALIVSPD